MTMLMKVFENIKSAVRRYCDTTTKTKRTTKN